MSDAISGYQYCSNFLLSDVYGSDVYIDKIKQ